MATLALEETEESTLIALRTARKTQIAQITALKRSVESAVTARDEAAADLRNLEYVSELTRDEIASRRGGNICLEKAYLGIEVETETETEKHHVDAVQKAEAQLLVAKAELSALRLSIDELHAHEKRVKIRTPRRVTPIRVPERLIADVDAVVVGNDVAAPGRVGVAPTGKLSLLGYHDSDPVREFDSSVFADDEACPIVPLTEKDEQELAKHMKAANVNIIVADEENKRDANTESAKIVGIVDALHATAAMVNATSSATTVGDQPLSPLSPKSSRRPLSD